jgi:very-short-patch-repair endonuclease
MAAALLAKPNAIAAGRSAAHLHQFPGFSQTRPVIMVGLQVSARSSMAKVIRSQRFDDVTTIRRRGFLVSSEAETVMTLARELSEERLETLVDELLARGSCSVEELATVADASDGVPGVPKLRRIASHRLADAYQPPTSELERLLYRILDDPRLPRYERQMPIRYRGARATVDACISPWRLIVEGDGRRWHTRKADMERDRLRDNEAVAHGYAVLRFTYEVLRDTPESVVDTVLRTGRVRRAS